MKKNVCFMILLILTIIPLNSYAVNDVNINCGKTKLNKNEEVTCTIVVNNLNFIATDITGQIQVGNNLSIVSSSYDNEVWLSLASKFSVSDIDLMRQEVSQKKSLTIATFKVKASATASGTSNITFKNIAMGNDLYNSVSLSTKTISIGFNSNINTLSSLSITGVPIDFSSEKTSYSLNIDSPSVYITATPTHSGAKVSGTGTRNLNYGNNKIDIVVTAEDGTTKTYVLNITRLDNRSTNNNLKSLSLSNGSLKFNKSTTTYNVDVDSNIDTLTINAELEDQKASFEKGFGPRKVNLVYGINEIQLKVKSENEIVKIYTIKVNRKDDRSSNNNLKNITLSNGTIEFNENVTEYTVNVPFEVEIMKIEAIAQDTKSKVEILGNETLVIGENIFAIKVIAENESVKEYKIKVIKDEKVVITNNNKLKNLEVEGHKLEFDPEIYSYTIKTSESKLNIKVELNDENSTYKINGNNDLSNGSIISIVVTDIDGNSVIYKLQIEKEDKVDLTKLYLIISICLNILLIIIIIIICIIKRNKNNSNGNFQKNKEEVEIIVDDVDEIIPVHKNNVD